MNIKAAYLRELAVRYLWTWLGLPYRWGGDDFSSFDCSGLIMEVLQGVGLELPADDKSADMLWQRYQAYEIATPWTGYPGCLALWFNAEGRAVHVEMMIDNDHTIGAAGGGSKTLTREDAIRMNAYVKMRPLAHRGGYKIVDPFLSLGD
jgi:cell wall-associated NlpC family hydrolase